MSKKTNNNKVMKDSNFISEKTFPINFKKLFFILTVFILCFNSLYAQKCKLERIKDDFSSGQTVYSKDVNLASVFPLVGSKMPWDLVMSFMLVDGSISISVTHQSQKYSSSLSSIFFKFQDGTILKKETPSTTGQYNTGLGYEYKFTGFFLTKEELELFASKDLLKFQADFSYFPDYPLVEENMKSKSVDKIRKDASCILEELNSGSTVKNKDKKEVKEVLEYNCGYEMDKIDGFTKKRNVLTKAALFYDIKLEGGHTFFQVCGSNNNGVNGLQFWRCYNVNGVAGVDEAKMKSYMLFDQVDILLTNDEPISLKTDVPSEYLLQAQANTAWSYKLFTIENDSIWQKLKTNPLKTLRLSINGKELGTQEIDENYSKSIVKVIDCVDALGISKSK